MWMPLCLWSSLRLNFQISPLNMENRNTKIKILKKGDLRWVNLQNIDIENSGVTNMSDINFKESGYVNKKSGTTNIEGKLNTNAPIKNEGLFNVKKTGEVNIFIENIKKFSAKHPWWFAIITGLITAIIFYFVQTLLKWY